jgi:hypothetical protein
VPDQLLGKLTTLHSSVHSLALGMKHKLQIDIPLEAARIAITEVRMSTRNPRSSADLATLDAILNSYEATSIEGIRFKAKNDPRLMEKLKQIVEERLMEDDAYWELSRCGCSFGIPRFMRPALVDFGRYSRNLLNHPQFKLLYRAGSRLCQVALKLSAGVKLPLPASGELSELLEQQYFPPIGPIPVKAHYEDWITFQLEQQENRLGLPKGTLSALSSRSDASSSKFRKAGRKQNLQRSSRRPGSTKG